MINIKKKKLCPIDASRWRVEIGNDYFIQSVDGAENFIFSWQIGRKKERKEEKNEIIEPARAENCFFEILIEFL